MQITPFIITQFLPILLRLNNGLHLNLPPWFMSGSKSNGVFIDGLAGFVGFQVME